MTNSEQRGEGRRHTEPSTRPDAPNRTLWGTGAADVWVSGDADGRPAWSEQTSSSWVPAGATSSRATAHSRPVSANSADDESVVDLAGPSRPPQLNRYLAVAVIIVVFGAVALGGLTSSGGTDAEVVSATDQIGADDVRSTLAPNQVGGDTLASGDPSASTAASASANNNETTPNEPPAGEINPRPPVPSASAASSASSVPAIPSGSDDAVAPVGSEGSERDTSSGRPNPNPANEAQPNAGLAGSEQPVPPSLDPAPAVVKSGSIDDAVDVSSIDVAALGAQRDFPELRTVSRPALIEMAQAACRAPTLARAVERAVTSTPISVSAVRSWLRVGTAALCPNAHADAQGTN